MKVIKNIFCIILKLSKEKVFFDKYKKGSMPKIKTWENKNIIPWKIFIFIWDRFAFALEKIANKKTIKIGRMKVIKNIFCIVLKRCKDRVFLNKNKKGITPKIKIWDNKNVMPWKIFIFIWDRFALEAVWDNVTNSLL